MPTDRAKQKAWYLAPRDVRERAGGRCECRGECGKGHQTRCEAVVGEYTPRSAFAVMLFAAHVHKGDCGVHGGSFRCLDPNHLLAMCQECRLAFDLPRHTAATRPQPPAVELVFDSTGHPQYATTLPVSSDPAPLAPGMLPDTFGDRAPEYGQLVEAYAQAVLALRALMNSLDPTEDDAAAALAHAALNNPLAREIQS